VTGNGRPKTPDCLMSKLWRNPCEEAAKPGDVLCARHAAYFRRRCPCGTRLADRRGVERRGGLCYRCYEKTPEYQARRYAVEKEAEEARRRRRRRG